MKKIKVLSVIGTRPEAVKMCPIILELEKRDEFDSVVCSTGQHKELLEQVFNVFNVKADYSLNIMRDNQTLTTISTDILQKMQDILDLVAPDIVLVHGDTSTSFSAALAAFYKQIPVGHVEAGLRTFNKYSPFPEEMNRVLTARIAEIHFAPTTLNKQNLFNENIKENVFITGNSVIDSFKTTIKKDYTFQSKELNNILIKSNKRLIVLTAHRRENLGEPIKNICNAVKEIANKIKDIEIICLMHPNPKTQRSIKSVLDDVSRVHLLEPVCVQDMHNLIKNSYLVLTDSGGLQEEAPYFGVPVLVLRTETERPEAVIAGTVKVVGVDKENIYKHIYELLTNENKYFSMSKAVSPYGDGETSKIIAGRIIEYIETINKSYRNEMV